VSVVFSQDGRDEIGYLPSTILAIWERWESVDASVERMPIPTGFVGECRASRRLRKKGFVTGTEVV